MILKNLAAVLWQIRKAGHKVFTATVTNGNIGSSTLSVEEIAKIRKEEARRAAALIGAEYICHDYDDEVFFENREARLKFIDLVRYCKADVILTHSPYDDNPDHELTTNLPLYSGMTKLLIGVSDKAQIMQGRAYTRSLPVVYYGSSVTQGGCATRPGSALSGHQAHLR